MKIAIICSYPLPYGMAATTRILSYSKGLVALGTDVEVISYMPSGTGIDNLEDDNGELGGVKYRYAFRRKRTRNRIIRPFEVLWSLLLLMRYLIKNGGKSKYDAIIVSSDNLVILCYMAFVNIMLRTRLLFIFDEFPIPIRAKLKKAIPAWKRKAYSFILHFYSGYISMTDTLLKYYQNISFHKGVIVSSITDISRFEKLPAKVSIQPATFKIVYMGNMELSKDNVDNILLSLNYLKGRYSFHLFLYGNPSRANRNELLHIIKSNELSDYVTFDYVSYTEVPTILNEADVLVSSQPDTVRAAGGFPTKLGEYLMTAKPVLCTEVGEIAEYFVNKKEVYLAMPGSPEDFADKLSYIFDNYKEALLVGEAGKQKIMNNYSHYQAGNIIFNFIKSL